MQTNENNESGSLSEKLTKKAEEVVEKKQSRKIFDEYMKKQIINFIKGGNK